jgi:hypothetical protein
MNPEVRALCAQIATERNERIYDALVAELTRVLNENGLAKSKGEVELPTHPSAPSPRATEIAPNKPLARACTSSEI